MAINRQFVSSTLSPCSSSDSAPTTNANGAKDSSFGAQANERLEYGVLVLLDRAGERSARLAKAVVAGLLTRRGHAPSLTAAPRGIAGPAWLSAGPGLHRGGARAERPARWARAAARRRGRR